AEHEKSSRDLGGSEDREDREHRAEEHHTRSPEEETRWMEVEEQETRDCSGQRETHPRDERLGDLRQKREASERERRDRGDAGGKNIQGGGEVEGLVHPDDPQHRERDGGRERELDQPIG